MTDNNALTDQKKMTSKQKTLAEKALKLRFNGLINALKATSSEVEEANQELPNWPPPHRWGPDHTISPTYPPQLAKLAQTAKSAVAAFQTALDTVNATRAERRDEARKVRAQIVEQLRQTRDNQILNIAFDGEGLDAFLAGLPTPESVAADLAALGIKLTAQLPMTTGIGERNPQELTENHRRV